MSSPGSSSSAIVRADRRGERIAADDDTRPSAVGPSSSGDSKARRLVDAQVLDVVDHEHARLLPRASARASRARSAARAPHATAARRRGRPDSTRSSCTARRASARARSTSRVLPEPSGPCSDTSETTARCCLSSASSSCRPTNGTGPRGVMGFVIFEVRRRMDGGRHVSKGCATIARRSVRNGSPRQLCEHPWTM